ncbi:hypothetical protein NDU88_006684 [Pleurodeles waltl]|uniref:Uncharacterized protein n=1 Tax=Pleurodeles waltl TaxID=8319 RepID=A0AAV7QLT7_PLEWA|nr:hypothetical protein NDU88_006684 [Pleurodeles waltl]
MHVNQEEETHREAGGETEDAAGTAEEGEDRRREDNGLDVHEEKSSATGDGAVRVNEGAPRSGNCSSWDTKACHVPRETWLVRGQLTENILGDANTRRNSADKTLVICSVEGLPKIKRDQKAGISHVDDILDASDDPNSFTSMVTEAVIAEWVKMLFLVLQDDLQIHSNLVKSWKLLGGLLNYSERGP